tara:strand:- start:72 stop:779 length:708 start_codon:yes stop_codon:yes gene_type:complete
LKFNAVGFKEDCFSVYNFQGSLPTGEFILSVSDYNYFLKYYKIFIDSALKTSNRVHLHILNPIEKIDVDNSLVTITTSYYPFNNKSLVAAYRFVIFREILSMVDYSMWQFDIDGYFNKEISFDFDSIGLILRTKEDFGDIFNRNYINDWDPDWWRVYCAAVFIKPEHIGFLDFVIDELKNSEIKWAMDQGALYRTYFKTQDQFNFFQISSNYINMWSDFENQHKYSFYHYGKGKD